MAHGNQLVCLWRRQVCPGTAEFHIDRVHHRVRGPHRHGRVLEPLVLAFERTRDQRGTACSQQHRLRGRRPLRIWYERTRHSRVKRRRRARAHTHTPHTTPHHTIHNTTPHTHHTTHATHLTYLVCRAQHQHGQRPSLRPQLRAAGRGPLLDRCCV